MNALPAGTHPVRLHAGANRLSLAMPALHTLTVVVEKPAAGGQLGLGPESRGFGFWQLQREIPESGRVVFERLPAGRYRLNVWGGGAGGEGMVVSVPDQAEVRYAPQAQDALAVSIEEETGTLAVTGLRDGDLVIGADGVEFADIQEAYRAVTDAQKGRRLLVVRGGARLEIALAAGALADPGTWRGSLEPTHR